MRLWRSRPVCEPEPAETRPEPVVPRPADTTLPLKDAVLRGWYNSRTGELFQGFRVGPDDIVADIGCGIGGNAGFCAEQGANLILTDIEPISLAEVAAKVKAIAGHGRIEHHVSDSDPLPIANAACTKIICSEVIEHVESPERLLKELVRIGKPGAQYLLTCPDPGSEALQKAVAPDSYFTKPFHVRVLDHEALGRLVEEAGLVIERRHGYGFYWNLWLVLFRACDVPMDRPEHELLASWTKTWSTLLDLPDGPRIKQAMDDMLPRSQLILARKPG